MIKRVEDLPMKAVKVLFPIPVLLAIIFLNVLPAAAAPGKGVTERECALMEHAEIIWDLTKYRWTCCIPEDDDLETCIPITDMKPLSKTSLKPLPPPGKKTIVLPAE
jgi:hypothetical protein